MALSSNRPPFCQAYRIRSRHDVEVPLSRLRGEGRVRGKAQPRRAGALPYHMAVRLPAQAVAVGSASTSAQNTR